MTTPEPVNGPIFVTGVTGYVGGRLAPSLLAAGRCVRCLAREPRKLEERPWRSHPNVAVVMGDMRDVESLARQMEGCPVAYYLVHSMESTGGRYAQHDTQLASNFAHAAARARVGRIIYLGGLGEMDAGLSQHLRSRREVEEHLASTGVPVTTLRAAMIIGAGSASFEILRYLVERLPVMVTPSWVKTESQPVAIADVLHWLVRCLDVPETSGKTLEIGGPDVLPYRALMEVMAEELHLPKRWILTLPFLTPRLSSLWISLVTPVSYRIARPLGEGLRNRVVVTNREAQRFMPHEPLPVREAIRQSLRQVESNDVETRWSAAGPVPGDPQWAGGTVFTDQRSVWIDSGPRAVFAAVCRIGGGNGWYAGDILWRIRGWMDTLVGGPGLRRGRRDSERVEFGEALDFWRVVGIDRNRSLSLRAEMKLPGVAMLKFDLEPETDGWRTRLTMTARFRPRGLLGILYWYAVLPLHNIVFGGMLNGMRNLAEATWREENPGPTAPVPATVVSPGYGRARLWLGICAVGAMVTLSSLGLTLDAPEIIHQALEPSLWVQILGLLAFVLIYAAVQLPFDLAGGYLLPKRFGRNHPPLGIYLISLSRGVAVHASTLFLAAAALMFAGRFAGIAGTVATGLIISLLLLSKRVAIAALMAPLRLLPGDPSSSQSGDALPIALAQSPDEGFAGGIVGMFRPRFQLIPVRWRESLGPEGFKVATRRRTLAATTGSWRRGRTAALMFTLAGIAACAWMVNPARLGAAGGAIEFSLWFSLWSFAGLLTLPTISRRGVFEIDERTQADGFAAEAMTTTTRVLNDFQDGETDRPTFVETVFHPIPSVSNRLHGPRIDGSIGFWDAARTAVYLGMAGLSLLGRAVHCNCGRPSLWVFLPTD